MNPAVGSLARLTALTNNTSFSDLRSIRPKGIGMRISKIVASRMHESRVGCLNEVKLEPETLLEEGRVSHRLIGYNQCTCILFHAKANAINKDEHRRQCTRVMHIAEGEGDQQKQKYQVQLVFGTRKMHN
ncbi:hypothetical protein V6N13_035579 [Hibiscus sabdariffa]|uniref:Uncharacterized protein n=1 Tax=Hibiscus sabdariffa TaxID=183260 RepID=A0ABR2S940_9ROSI